MLFFFIYFTKQLPVFARKRKLLSVRPRISFNGGGTSFTSWDLIHLQPFSALINLEVYTTRVLAHRYTDFTVSSTAALNTKDDVVLYQYVVACRKRNTIYNNSFYSIPDLCYLTQYGLMDVQTKACAVLLLINLA